MFKFHFHKYKIVAVQKSLDFYDRPISIVLYKCTYLDCLKLKTKEIDGHWKLEELQS